MSVFRRGSNVFHYEFMMNGRRYRGSTKETTLSRARQYESITMGKVRDGDSPSVARRHIPTLRELSERFLEFVIGSNRIAPKSRKYYLFGLQLLEGSPVMNKRLDRITSQDADCIKIKGSPSTVNCGLRTLRRMLNLAVEWDLLQKAPRIHLQEELGRSALISADTERRLLDSLKGTCSPAIVLMLDTGARPQEVCRLKVENLDFERGTIFIESGKTRKARRYLPMSDRVIETLREQIGSRTTGWVFPSPRYPDQPIQRASLSQAFNRTRNKLGLPKDLKLYNARHSFATDLMQKTGNVFLMQELMGHTDVKTLGRYQHPSIAGVANLVNQRNLERQSPQMSPQYGSGTMEASRAVAAIA
jgi:integrase